VVVPVLAFLCAACVAACGDQAYRGSWEVVGYKRPSMSPLGDPEAQLWAGTKYDLSADRAIVTGLVRGADTCEVGKAQRQTLSVFDVEMTYDLTKGELGLGNPDVDLLDIQCKAGGLPWGQNLIRVSPDSLLAPWNGIFLVLGRPRAKTP
jgi:hypothetical protein